MYEIQSIEMCTLCKTKMDTIFVTIIGNKLYHQEIIVKLNDKSLQSHGKPRPINLQHFKQRCQTKKTFSQLFNSSKSLKVFCHDGHSIVLFYINDRSSPFSF